MGRCILYVCFVCCHACVRVVVQVSISYSPSGRQLRFSVGHVLQYNYLSLWSAA
jgi:hypothetical protein